jgi:integrase
MIRKSGHEPVYETFATRREAATWMRNKETELESRVVTDPRILITDLIDDYVVKIAPTRRMAKSHLKHDIPTLRNRWAGVRMKDLLGRGLTDWVLANAKELSPTTLQWQIARLYGLLRQAELHWSVTVPWTDMSDCQKKLQSMGYIQKSGERDRRVSDVELAAIKAQLVDRKTVAASDIFDFCMATAMRIGEVTRIVRSDIDHQAKTIVIRDRKHPTKKFGNHQVVPLLGDAYEIIKRQPETRAMQKTKRDVTPAGTIFPHCTTYMSKVFHRAAVKAAVHDVRLHDLRHEAISRLFELGFQIQEVAMVSGHTNWRTLERYTHLRPASLVQREMVLRSIRDREIQPAVES